MDLAVRFGATALIVAAAMPSTSFFSATIRGVIDAELHGRSEFGTVASSGSPSRFTIRLGAADDESAILITGAAGADLRPGTYPVSEADEPTSVRVLVVTGGVEKPSGVFRGHTGVVTITSTEHGTLTGHFELRATGFLAGEPALDDRPIAVKGAFAVVAGAPGKEVTP
jgi:hypothetical protein